MQEFHKNKFNFTCARIEKNPRIPDRLSGAMNVFGWVSATWIWDIIWGCLVGDQNLPRLTFGTVAAKESDVIKIKATPVARFDKKKKVYDM